MLNHCFKAVTLPYLLLIRIYYKTLMTDILFFTRCRINRVITHITLLCQRLYHHHQPINVLTAEVGSH
jgi:hypothetical protein